jgi:hypothetical protein
MKMQEEDIQVGPNQMYKISTEMPREVEEESEESEDDETPLEEESEYEEENIAKARKNKGMTTPIKFTKSGRKSRPNND